MVTITRRASSVRPGKPARPHRDAFRAVLPRKKSSESLFAFILPIMKRISKSVLNHCFKPIKRFIDAFYRIEDLATLIGMDKSILSRKSSRYRWKISELESLFEARGYRLTLSMQSCLGNGSGSARALGYETGRLFPCNRVNCTRLRFLQEYIWAMGLSRNELDRLIGYGTVRYAFANDDMKFSNLLSFAASLNAEVLFDVTPLTPSIRNQVGGLLLVSFQSKEYINLIDK